MLALHALLGFVLLSAVVRQRNVPESARVSVRLLPAPARAEVPASSRAGAARAVASPRPVVRAAGPSEHSVQVDAAPITAEAASAPSPTADTNLLDTDASRAAIHSAARNPNLASRVDAQVGVHSPTAARRLPENIRQASKGDCVKGEYPGAGMGLLSLPFFAAALAAGNCAQ